MSEKKQKTSTNLDSVDQIRNILFGEQINVIEQRFAKLEESLTKAIDTLSKKNEQANKALLSKIESTNKALQSDNSQLASQHAEDLKSMESAINNKIIETESELLNQIQSGLKDLDNKASHRNELAELLKEMAIKLAD